MCLKTMKVRLGLLLLCLLSTTLSYAQRYAVANGDWSDPIWAITSTGVAGSAATPTAADDVYTNGFSVTVNSNVACKNLNVTSSVSNGLVIPEFSFYTLTIYGQLAGTAGPPISDALVMGEFETIRLEGGGQKIGPWLYSCPLSNVIFNPGDGASATVQTGFRIANGGTVTIESGTLSIATNSNGRQIRGGSDCALKINSGAILNTNSAINGGGTSTTDAPTTFFGSIIIDGTLITTSYVNSTNFTVNATGELQTSFNGANQTQGWWYQAYQPTGGTLDAGSTIIFNAAADQNIYTRQYGNLSLNGASIKKVAGSGSLNLYGNLVFLNTGITLNSTFPVIFNGTTAQSISGGGTANLTGGLQVNKSTGIFSLGQDINVQNGITVSAGGTLDASNYTTTLVGTINNSGTISFGTGASLGTLIVNGSVSAIGSVPSLGHLTINATGSFSNAGTVNVAGNIDNGGSVNVTGINFNGTSAQTVNGALSLSEMTVNNATGVANNGSIDVTGVVTLSGSGVFDADGSAGNGILRLKSTGLTTTARIATLPNPSLFSGNVTVERFINTPEDWRYLAIPITDGNVGMWQDDFPVTGKFSNPSSGGNVVNSTSASIYYYDGAWTEVGSGGTTTATPLSNTTGYSVWSYLSNNVSIDVTGQIAKGQRSVSIRSGDNLIPNPYPSAIDWDNVNLNGANLSSNTIYVRTANGTYASYVQGANVGSNHPLAGWAGEVALGQSFWVLGAGNGTLNFQEDDKTSSTYFVRETQPSNYLRIKLEKDNVTDEVVIYFNEDATTGKDVQFDAPKKLNDIELNLSTFNADPALDYAINGIPLVHCSYTTGLKLGATNPTGNYSLSFAGLSSIKLGYDVVLKDKFLNIEKPVTEGMTYPFGITSDPASGGADRFEILFRIPDIDQSRELSMESTLECETSTAKITINNSQPGVNYQFKLNDATLNEPVQGNGNTIEVAFSAAGLTYGLNSLNLLATSANGCHSFEFADAFTFDYQTIPEISSVLSTNACEEGTVTLNAFGAPADGFYRWYETADAAESIEGATASQFITPVISKTKTYYVAAVNAAGCEGQRVAAQATVVHLPIPVINVSGKTLEVPAGLGEYQWFLDDEPVKDATASSYEVKKSGTYTVRVSSNTCSVFSDGLKFLLNGSEHKAESDYYDLYPNPISNTLVVKGPDIQRSSITVYDRTGQRLEVSGEFDTDENGQTVFLVDFTHVRNGVYLLNIQNGSKLVQLKVIKR